METTTTDSLIIEYRSEIHRITREISVVKARLQKAKTVKTQKRLRRTLYTLYVGRGQLRRTVKYMESHERYVIPPSVVGRRVILSDQIVTRPRYKKHSSLILVRGNA